MNALSWIQTRSPCERTVTELRLRPRGHWDRQCNIYMYIYICVCVCVCVYTV